MTGDQAGNHFGLNIYQRFHLRLCEMLHIVMRKSNIIFELLRHQGSGGLNLFTCQHDITVIAVEFPGIILRCRFATGFNVIEDFLHGLAHILGIGGCGHIGFLQIVELHGKIPYFRRFVVPCVSRRPRGRVEEHRPGPAPAGT